MPGRGSTYAIFAVIDRILREEISILKEQCGVMLARGSTYAIFAVIDRILREEICILKEHVVSCWAEEQKLNMTYLQECS